MIVVLNNKSNLTKKEFVEYQEKLKEISTDHKLVLCPTYLNINLFNLDNFYLGSQNVSNTKDGAYTGEISAQDLRESNVTYSLVGHSERRKYQNETNQDINSKIKMLLENDIIPILCVGETKEERDNNIVEVIIKTDIEEAIEGISEEDKEKIIIAYEPIWSIGTGLVPNVDDIITVNRYIKDLLPNNKFIYGGSVTESNIDELKSKEIEGYLLGGLSLKPEQLKSFIDKV